MDAFFPDGPPPCRAAGLPPKEKPVPVVEEKVLKFLGKKKEKPNIRVKNEVFYCDVDAHSQLEEMTPEEEESLDRGTPRWVKLDEIQKELSGLKLRVSHLNKKFRLCVPKCPDIDPCRHIGLEAMKLDTHPDIQDLQRNNQKLIHQQTQLGQVAGACNLGITHLKNALSQSMCSANSIQGMFGKLDCFQRNLEKEQALCLQRFRAINHRKLNSDLKNVNYSITFDLEEHCGLKYKLERMLTFKQFTESKKLACQVVFNLKSGAMNLLDVMHTRIHSLDDRLYYPDRHQTLMSFIERNSSMFEKRKSSIIDQAELDTS
ncbi:hypothetical protein KR074_012250 [Drosophila pseudoananassae]|nr:hypothetical protein KR074_012250 [Drosophila pseudoananassae]